MISKSILKDACQLSLQEELEEISNTDLSGIIYHSLSDDEVEQLATKINLLPLEYHNILFFRYCFNNTPTETDRILETVDSIGKLRYTHKLLSDFMGLGNLWIDNDSMKKACDIALLEGTNDYDNIQILQKPNYSKDFRRKLKNIKINQNLNSIFVSIAKRVAIFIIVAIVSFSAVLTVNAEMREKVFNWMVEIFEEYSIFTPKNNNEDGDIIELASFKINYIPTGFELKYIHKGRSMLIYEYSTEDNQELVISLFSSNGNGKSYYDTENAEIEEFIFKNSQAFTWQTDSLTYLIWHQDGTQCHITGNLSKEEILKVAENISK